MDKSFLVELWSEALVTAAMVGTPFLVLALIVGLLTSLLQAATQMQENILSFFPKLIAVGIVMALAGNWLLDRLETYTKKSFETTIVIGRGETP